MRLLLIQNCQIERLTLFERRLGARATPYEVWHPYRGGPPPGLDRFDAIIVGGTPASANDVEHDPCLSAEWEYLQRALEADKPYLGVCCGGQMLARLLGATVRPNPKPEIGGYRVRLTPAGQTDPLLAGFPATFPVFHWHGETFDIPQNGSLLVEGDDCPNQLFRCGRWVGAQFHLEATPADARAWTAAYHDELSRVDKSADQVVEECRRSADVMAALSARLLDNFLAA